MKPDNPNILPLTIANLAEHNRRQRIRDIDNVSISSYEEPSLGYTPTHTSTSRNSLSVFSGDTSSRRGLSSDDQSN